MTCGDALLFFNEKPGAAALYEAFEERVLSQVGPAEIRVQKTQIAFSNRHNFAFVSLLPVRRARERPETYITVSFGLGRRLDSPRVDASVEPYPGRWTHHVLLSRPEEIDGELLNWLREAYAFSLAKR